MSLNDLEFAYAPVRDQVRDLLKMTKTQRTGFILILLSCGISILSGYIMQRSMPLGMLDFKGLYYNTRCLLLHLDPYKTGEPLRVYLAENRNGSQPPIVIQRVLTWNVYPPTAFILTAPFAVLPCEPSYLLWILLTAGSYTIAAFLLWRFAARYSPKLSLLLICIVLTNCQSTYIFGNPAGFVVSLCIIAAYCFLTDRYVPVGILCLAIGLAVKPHDSGLVWFYFLLAGGVFRKRALQALIVFFVLVAPMILWVTCVAPHWIQELRFNLLVTCMDESFLASGICLNTVTSIFWHDSHVYNSISNLILGSLLLIWSVRTLRSRLSQRGALLALAAIVPLEMILTYHHDHDAKLILLAIPACVMLWSEGGPIRWLALSATTAGIAITAEIPNSLYLVLINSLHLSTTTLSGQMLNAVLTRINPLVLLAMSCFYMWVYLRREATSTERQHMLPLDEKG